VKPEETDHLEDAKCIKYWKTFGIREMHTGYWWGNLKKKGRLENLDVNVRI
jgi:hypothetical protein